MAAPKYYKKKWIHFTYVLKLNTKTLCDMIEIQSTGIMYSTVTILPKIQHKKHLLPNGFKKQKRRLILFGRQQQKK